MTDDLEHPDDAERAEAAALASALEDREGVLSPPREALQTASLLRSAGPRGELDAGRGEAILQALLEQPVARRKARLRLPLAFGFGFAAAAAVALFFVVATRSHAPALPQRSGHALAPVGSPPLPQASARLLAAQTHLIKRADDPIFMREMHAYRLRLFEALQARYPTKLSQLRPEETGRP